MDFINAGLLLSNYVLLPGLAYGSQLALGALGITLIYSVLRFSNFAHGDMMAFGTMITILFTWWFQHIGLSISPLPTALLALPFGILATIALSLVIDRSIYRFYRAKKSPPVVLVIVSIGVMFFLNGLVRFILGPGDIRFADGERFIIKAREFKQLYDVAEGLSIRYTQGITIVIAILLAIALFWFLAKTKTGKAMRAYSDNQELALLSGIEPDKVVRVTWILAAILATTAGVLYGLDKSYKPFTYFQLLLPMFSAAIVGGIGHPLGAIVGAYVIAFSELIITYAYKKFFIYTLPESWQPEGLSQLLSTDYKFAVSFIILVIVLLIRPTGLFKGNT